MPVNYLVNAMLAALFVTLYYVSKEVAVRQNLHK